jgi:fluoride exporter
MADRSDPARPIPSQQHPASVVERIERRGRRWSDPLPRQEAAIAGGAIVGVGARFAITSMVPLAAGLPLGTLVVNLLGCLLIGVMQTLFLELIAVRREAQLFVSVGLLGGFTTFSTISVETIDLLRHGAIATALLYQAISLIGGALAVLAGIVIAHALHHRRRRS